MAYASPSVTQSGLGFAAFQAAGISGLLEALITANTGPTAAPTVAATLAAASGGTLPNDTYTVKVTETNGFGETTAGPASSGQAANAQKITVTFQALKSGNTARNVYIAGAAGVYMLVARGITAATYDITALPTDSRKSVQPPTVNTAGMQDVGAPRKLSFARAAEKGNLQDVYRAMAEAVRSFNSGRPIASDEVIAKIRDAHVTFALLAQLCAEAGTLADANNGSFSNTADGAGVGTVVRVWP
jgi:hypothetical protein